MRVPLDSIDSRIDADNRSLLRRLRQRAGQDSLLVYLVGGPVRDLLLNAPIKDLDFVLEGDAPALAHWLAEDSGGRVVVHQRFGTATVALGRARVDLVTARREVYPHPGALPQVSPGTIHDDLARRDFSINAMALPLLASAGESGLLDPLGGAADLASGTIRILHPASFADDPTRIFRAIRYEQRLSFVLAASTLGELQKAVQEGCLSSVSGDRLRHELERILEERQPQLALVRAVELGVLPAINPALASVAHLNRMAAALEKVADADPLLYLSALAYPLSRGEGESVMVRLQLPNLWAEVVRDTIELRQLEFRLAAASLAPSQVCRLLEGRAIVATQGVSLLADSDRVRQRMTRFLEVDRFVHPELNGADLLAMGVGPGPVVGRLLRQLTDARRDGRTKTRREEEALVREFLATEGDRQEGGL